MQDLRLFFNRRNFLIFLTSWLTSISFKGKGFSQETKPNILLLIADDWAWPDASILGNKVLQTPNFDKIAQEGILFTNVFISTPSCTASRSSLLTGQWPWQLKEAANLLGPLRPEFTVFPDLLEQAGYYIGFSGKGCGPTSNDLALGRYRNPAGIRFNNFSQFLDQKPVNQPFYFWYGSKKPHRPYPWQIGLKNGMKLEDVVVPSFLPDSEIVRTDLCDYYWKIQQFDYEVGQIINILQKKGHSDSTLVIIASDNGSPFPRAKHNLYGGGTHIPMAMRWSNRIQKGQIIDDLISLPDLAPSILEIAGVNIPETMTAKSFFNLSEGTIKLKQNREHILFGRERDNLAQKDRKSGYPMRGIRTQNYLYILNFRPERWPAGFPLVYLNSNNEPLHYLDIDPAPTKDYMMENSRNPEVIKLFVRAFAQRPGEELYDLIKDPQELNNVADKPEYAQIKQELNAQLIAELELTQDPRMGERGDIFDAYPFTY